MMAHHADELLVNFYELSADRPAGWRPPVGSAAPLAVAPAPAVGGARADLVGALWLLPGSTWPIAAPRLNTDGSELHAAGLEATL